MTAAIESTRASGGIVRAQDVATQPAQARSEAAKPAGVVAFGPGVVDGNQENPSAVGNGLRVVTAQNRRPGSSQDIRRAVAKITEAVSYSTFDWKVGTDEEKLVVSEIRKAQAAGNGPALAKALLDSGIADEVISRVDGADRGTFVRGYFRDSMIDFARMGNDPRSVARDIALTAKHLGMNRRSDWIRVFADLGQFAPAYVEPVAMELIEQGQHRYLMPSHPGTHYWLCDDYGDVAMIAAMKTQYIAEVGRKRIELDEVLAYLPENSAAAAIMEQQFETTMRVNEINTLFDIGACQARAEHAEYLRRQAAQQQNQRPGSSYGGGNSRPGSNQRPGSGNSRPGSNQRPGSGNSRPGSNQRPGSGGNSRPGSNQRPGSGGNRRPGS